MILSTLFYQGNIKRTIELTFNVSYARYFVIFTYPDYINKKTLKPFQHKREFTSSKDVKNYLFYFLTASEYKKIENLHRADLVKPTDELVKL